jgi:hypothetical protein
MLSKFEYDGKLNPNVREGPFSLVISSIDAYTDAKTPRSVVIWPRIPLLRTVCSHANLATEDPQPCPGT